MNVPRIVSAAPLLVVACVALATALQVGCSDSQDDEFSEDPLYGYTPLYVEPNPFATCWPKATRGVPAWSPPAAARQGACTEAQIASLVPCLLGGTCPPPALGDDGCRNCLLPPSGAGGVLLRDESGVRHSRGACAALMANDRTMTSCGGRVELADRCNIDACAECSDSSRSSCGLQAAGSVCAGYAFGATCWRSQTTTVRHTCEDPLLAAAFVCGTAPVIRADAGHD